MRRVLLTGASGFIGRHCISPLILQNFKVHCAHRTGEILPESGAVWHRVDLLKPDHVQRLIDEVAPTHLLHLAWSFGAGGVDAAPKGSCPNGYRWTMASLEMIRRFAEAGGERIVTAGSSFEYDWSGDGVCREHQTPRIATTYYGACKNALGDLVTGFADHMGISSAWARVFFLYGPHEPAARLVPSVIASLLRSEPALCSHGNQIRDYLFVQDVADALVALLAGDVRGPVNIGSQEPIALKQIVTGIGERIGRPDLIRLGALKARANDVPQVLADTTRLNREVGWRPRYDLCAGLDATIGWWRTRIGSEFRPLHATLEGAAP